MFRTKSYNDLSSFFHSPASRPSISNSLSASSVPFASSVPSASSVPPLDIGTLILNHTIFIARQTEVRPAGLSETFSKIKKTLSEDKSISATKEAQINLEVLLISINDAKEHLLLKTLKAKSEYLLACCMVYVECHSNKLEVDLDVLCRAVKLLESAKKSMEPGKSLLPRLERALNLIKNYYELVCQSLDAAEAHNSRVSNSKTNSPVYFQSLYRQELGQASFIRHYTGVLKYLMSEIPRLMNGILDEAIDLNSKKERYNSPRHLINNSFS